MRREHSLYVRLSSWRPEGAMSSDRARLRAVYFGFVDALARAAAPVFRAARLAFFVTFFFTFGEPVATRLE